MSLAGASDEAWRDVGARAPVVLLVSFSPALGGAERSLLALAEHLPGQGWAPVVVCPPGALADAAARAGVDVRRSPVKNTSGVRRGGGHRRYSGAAALAYGWGTVRNAWHISRAARACGACAIHSNSLSSHIAAAVAGSLVRRPVFWHLREITRAGAGRRILTRFAGRVAGIVAISTAVAEVVEHVDVRVVENPVDAAPTTSPVASWSFPPPVVGYLGRITPEKGVEDLVRAAGGIDAHVVVVGEPWGVAPDYLPGLVALADRLAPGRVHFVGGVADPWQALAVMDVLVVPSHAEPWGRVAAEAQSAGVPVLAADAGGLPDIVTDGVDGLLFPPKDPEALAGLLRKVLADPQLRGRLSAAARVRAQRYEPARHARAMAALFCDAIVKDRAQREAARRLPRATSRV